MQSREHFKYPFKLPEMGYSYNSLEPNIDALTMEIHYTKHHGAYVNNLNAAIEKYPYLQNYHLEDLLVSLSALPADIVDSVKNNGGGHLNHTIWWDILTPGGSNVPVGQLAQEIKETFGSFDSFKEQFNKAAMSRFGSGWAWLVLDRFGKLHIISTPNQDNPIMQNLLPIFGVDVWEHSYYLKYQNRRADYLNAVWNVLNWDIIEKRYQELKKSVSYSVVRG
ncbi:MAG: superoxide dismutase [bacterium]|nr:superoxide dismutase [bacterium]